MARSIAGPRPFGGLFGGGGGLGYRPAPNGGIHYRSMESLPPMPAFSVQAPMVQQQVQAGFGLGHLDVMIRQQDIYGARIGQDVTHRMNMRTARPYGQVSIEAVNGVL
jgi:hypothetical protein